MKKPTLITCLAVFATLMSMTAPSAQVRKDATTSETKTLHVTVYTPGHDYVNKNHISAANCDGQFNESIMRRTGDGTLVQTSYTITLARIATGGCNLVVSHRGRDPSYLSTGNVPMVEGVLTLPIDFAELGDIHSTHMAGPWLVSLKGQK